MMAIEKTKIIEMNKQEKIKKKNYLKNLKNDLIIDTMNSDSNIKKDYIGYDIIEEDENEIEIPYSNINSNSSALMNEKESEKNKNPEKEEDLDYQRFKEKFVSALK